MSPVERDVVLGSFRQLSAGAAVLGALAFALSLVLTVVLQRWQHRLKFAEQKTWWASNGRDLLNTACWGALALGLYLFGFPGPASVLLGATLLLVLNLIESALLAWPKAPRPTLIALGVALVIGTPVLATPTKVFSAMERVAQALAGTLDSTRAEEGVTVEPKRAGL